MKILCCDVCCVHMAYKIVQDVSFMLGHVCTISILIIMMMIIIIIRDMLQDVVKRLALFILNEQLCIPVCLEGG